MTAGPQLSRRTLLRAAVLGGAAAAVGAPRAAAQTPEWAGLVAAAKKEGKVVVNTFPGDGYGRALKPFTQAYPEIKLEHTSLHSQDFAPRIMQERRANSFTWDVVTIPTSTALQVLRPAGVWDPIRPVIVLPEAKDDAGWEGGFERGFSVVNDRALTYGFLANRGGGVTINTDQVKEDQVRTIQRSARPAMEGQATAARRACDGRCLLADDQRPSEPGRRHHQAPLRGSGASAEPR
jgi:ABC-type glycerol-3-phosphate transport system substrate-binding protein